MRNSVTIKEAFGGAKKFHILLTVAELNAATAWECDFTDDMRASFEEYGARMLISPLQQQQLKRIARED